MQVVGSSAATSKGSADTAEKGKKASHEPKAGSGVSSNLYASGSSQNTGNVITDRPTSRVTQPPGGKSSISFFWCVSRARANNNQAIASEEWKCKELIWLRWAGKLSRQNLNYPMSQSLPNTLILFITEIGSIPRNEPFSCQSEDLRTHFLHSCWLNASKLRLCPTSFQLTSDLHRKWNRLPPQKKRAELRSKKIWRLCIIKTWKNDSTIS